MSDKFARRNRLNNLSGKDWLKFQKSWFVHNPPPRRSDVMLHPAKFPESLIQEFIEFFTKSGETVLDPMLGTGSTLIACLRSGRRGVGIELMPKYADIARERVASENPELAEETPSQRIIQADAGDLAGLDLEPVDYVITSPPYWDMLRRKGFETQQERAEAGLDVHYSDEEADVGNIEDYEEFLEALCGIYRGVATLLKPKRYMTVIVKNVKKGGVIYPLAWDLGKRIGEFLLLLKDEKIWCQDNQRLAPFGMGSAWVSNTMHHYCLNFRQHADAGD